MECHGIKTDGNPGLETKDEAKANKCQQKGNQGPFSAFETPVIYHTY
jgi:hypothetical protein